MIHRREVGGALRASPDRVGKLFGRTRSRLGATLGVMPTLDSSSPASCSDNEAQKFEKCWSPSVALTSIAWSASSPGPSGS
jgi:hypothetical protein